MRFRGRSGSCYTDLMRKTPSERQISASWEILTPALRDIFAALRPAALQILWFVRPMVGLFHPASNLDAYIELIEEDISHSSQEQS